MKVRKSDAHFSLSVFLLQRIRQIDEKAFCPSNINFYNLIIIPLKTWSAPLIILIQDVNFSSTKDTSFVFRLKYTLSAFILIKTKEGGGESGKMKY